MNIAVDGATLLLSLKTAFVATVFAGAFGLIAALLMARREFYGKAVVDALLLAPLVLPPTVVGYLLLLCLGTNGPLGKLAIAVFGQTILFTWSSAVIAAAIVAMPLMYRTVRGSLEQIDERIPAAAKTLGASDLRIARRILLPLAKPGIIAGLLLAFARALGEFGATLMVAGNLPGRTRTLPLAIYTDVETGDLAHAGIWVGLILLLTVVLATVSNIWGAPRRRFMTNGAAAVRIRPEISKPMPKVTPRVDSATRSLDVRLLKRLGDFSLDVAFQTTGRAIAILGPSGAGKSLLLRCLSGLETPDSGAIALNGRTIFAGNSINVPTRLRQVGHVFQNYALFPHMKATTNVAFGLDALPVEEQATRVVAWLTAFDLETLSERFPEELSGGQAQRVALARALATEPHLLLLDEPLAALDTHLKARIEQHLRSAVEQFPGITVMVTHNLEEAFRICDDLIVLDHGRIIASGEKHAVLDHPGTVVAAALTGCKNIAAVNCVGDKMRVAAWGVDLPTPSGFDVKATHVGIRAHHLKLSVEQDAGGQSLPCRLASASETPHRMTLFLTLNEAATPLQVEVLKDVWEGLRTTPGPWYLKFPSDKLLALKGSQ